MLKKSLKNKIRYREKWQITDRMEIFEANVLILLVIEENSIVISAEPTLTYSPVCHKMSISKFKHKIQGTFMTIGYA